MAYSTGVHGSSLLAGILSYSTQPNDTRLAKQTGNHSIYIQCVWLVDVPKLTQR